MKIKRDGQTKLRQIKRINFDLNKDEVPLVWSKSRSVALEQSTEGRKLLENYRNIIESLTHWCDLNNCMVGHIKLFLENERASAWISSVGEECSVDSSREFEEQYIQQYQENLTVILFGKDQKGINNKLYEMLT